MICNARNVTVEDKRRMKRLIYAIIFLTLGTAVLSAQDYKQAFDNVQQAFEQRSEAAIEDLKEYLKVYPYTPYANEVHAMLGVLWTENKKYEEAIEELEKVDVKELSRTTEPMYYFYMGYSYLKLEKYDHALANMLVISTKHNNPYTLQASYYAGFCYYSLKEYSQALVEFLSLEQVGGYRKIAPYYIVQIYYAMSEYDKVLERAEQLLADYPENEYNDELHRMAGEIYYRDSLYDKAASHLESYRDLRIAKNKEVIRNDLYLLGVSNYRIQQYNQAINYLKEVKHENDSISESTYLHLGHSYLRTDNLEKAILAYAAAIESNINPTVREEAMYNYVQATYLQNSALGEGITAFQTFIKEYPHSKYIDKVYALMADLYMTSKNYQAALDALLEIEQPNDKVKQTCQYLRYQLAVDAFLQDKMNDVLEWGNELIANEEKQSEYKTEAHYLCAQAYYRLHLYADVIGQIDLYQQQANIAQSKNQQSAIYLKAYALFNQKEYLAADSLYREYIHALGNDTKNTTYADALNRLGDCLFHKRNFQEASAIYTQVAEFKSIGADYAMMQNGYAQGLMHNYAKKVDVLTSLTQEYPYSDYADDAFYEIARAELQQEHNNEAITAYHALLKNYPNSNCAAKASLEMGMTYRTLKQYDNAIETFKTTINTYTGSEEAYSSLENLEQIFVETNKVEEYIAYTKTLDNMQLQTANSEDSLIYVTAELQYMMGNYREAAAGFTTYLKSFCPGGRYCINATYYSANSFYQLEQYDQAIEQYSALADVQGNPYMEEACMRIAELSYDKKEYRTALYYFQRMSEVASSSSKHMTALLGILRCSYNIEEPTTIIDVATRLLEEPVLDSVTHNEVLYCRAKAYINSQQYGLAIVDLSPVAKEVRTAHGAEAKYLLAECYYHLNAMDMAEEEIMSFTQQQTSQQYWLAKSLILLSDINVERNELFQAKQYLLALQKNYHAQNDIQTIIENKLQHIAQLEIQQNADTAQIQ